MEWTGYQRGTCTYGQSRGVMPLSCAYCLVAARWLHCQVLDCKAVSIGKSNGLFHRPRPPTPATLLPLVPAPGVSLLRCPPFIPWARASEACEVTGYGTIPPCRCACQCPSSCTPCYQAASRLPVLQCPYASAAHARRTAAAASPKAAKAGMTASATVLEQPTAKEHP